MQNVDLDGYLAVLKWSQGELSRKIDVNKNTVNRWMTGKSKVPKVVLMYLNLLCEFKRHIEK